MRVEANVTCLVTGKREDRATDITDDATIRDLIGALGLSFGTTSIDIEKHYEWAPSSYRMDSMLPYLIVDNR